MKYKTSNFLVIILFILLITLPQILAWIMGKNNIEISIAENRNLYQKPKLELATITTYPQKYENYYNDNLPFRENFIDIWSKINYKFFNTSVDNRCVIGKDGWLFYRGDDALSKNNVITQIQGISEFSENEKKNILENLKLNNNKLKANNIEMYILVLPNKENIYREYLPDSISIKNNTSRTENLIEYIKNNSDINIIYPKNELLKVKEKYQIYRKYDTHWNRIGSCIGTIALQKSIDKKFAFDIYDIEVEEIKEKDNNDLAIMAGVKELHENTLKVKNFYTQIEYKVNKEETYEEYISNSSNDKTVLFIGDSFRENMREDFSKLYKRVVYVHRGFYTEDLIQKIKPNIVVYEILERYSTQLNKQIIK